MIYSASFTGIAVTVAQDLFEILVPSDAVLRVHSIVITQSSDAKNSESEQLRFSLKRITGSPTSGSGGGSVTPVAFQQGLPASGATVERNNTTRLTGGTSYLIWTEAVNIMSGWYFLPTPELRPSFSPSTYCLVGLEAAPEDELTMHGTITFEEIGG